MKNKTAIKATTKGAKDVTLETYTFTAQARSKQVGSEDNKSAT